MNADRAAADLGAIEHHVVCLREREPGRRTHLGRIVRLGRGERVMHGDPSLLVRVPLEHGEVDHPQGPQPGLKQLAVLPDFEPQCTDRVVDDLGRSGAEEDEVVVASAGALEDAAHGRIAQEFDDR